MKISKRLGIVCAIVLALLGLVGFAVYWLVVDVPPPDLSDLEVKRRVVAPADNGFLLVDISDADFHQDTESVLAVLSKERDTLAPDAARDILRKNEAVLDLFAQSLEKPDFQVREYDPAESMALYWSAWRTLGVLIEQRFALALNEGRSSAAVDAAFEVGEFGRRIENSQGVLITYLLGASVKARAADLLTRAVSAGGLDVPALKDVIQRLEPWRNGDAALKDSLRGEFWIGVGAVEPGQLGGAIGHLLISENDTKGRIADVFRMRIANVSRRPSERQAVDKDWLTGGIHNFVGRQLVAALYANNPMDYLFQRRDRTRLWVEMTRVVAGLRGHVLEHGKLPERLDELVPHYLASVPRDIFDGKPLRYSREKQVVYSIGKDGVDSGGATDSAEPGWYLEHDDPTYQLDAEIEKVAGEE